ncbi:MAG: hypothetical protein Q9163_002063 [Psora crenata]
MRLNAVLVLPKPFQLLLALVAGVSIMSLNLEKQLEFVRYLRTSQTYLKLTGHVVRPVSSHACERQSLNQPGATCPDSDVFPQVNKAIHIGTNTSSLVPMPQWLLIPNLPPNLGTIFTLVYAVLYILMEPVAGGLLAPMLLVGTAFTNHLTSTYGATANYWALGVFVTSWIAQFIGHGAFEGRAPALLDNLVQALFLAPFFVWMEVLFSLGYRPELKARVEKAVEREVEKFRRTKHLDSGAVNAGEANGGQQIQSSTMYFLHELERVITLHPSFFGPRVKEYLTSKLLEDVEGTCTGQYYIICVMDTYDISEGRVVPGSAVAEYTMHYRAVVWRPFKGETVDAIVSSVNRMGVFADVGPLPVFVSNHLIPPGIKWDPNATPPQYTDNGDQVIEKGTQLRIKLIGTRSDVGSMFAIGSIKEDFLGIHAKQNKMFLAKAIQEWPYKGPRIRGRSVEGPHEAATSSLKMASRYKDEESRPLNLSPSLSDQSRASIDSLASSSDTSIALERLNGDGAAISRGHSEGAFQRHKNDGYAEEDLLYGSTQKASSKKTGRRSMWILGALCFGGWLLALLLLVSRKTYEHVSSIPYDPAATVSKGSGKAVTMNQVLSGYWNAQHQHISWIPGANGEDGLLLEKGGGEGRDYLVVEDVRSRKPHTEAKPNQTLMKDAGFSVGGVDVSPNDVWPSQDLKKVLVISEIENNWRHSYTGLYWIFDVETQQAEPLDPAKPNDRIQLAKWSPQSDAIIFTRDNNMFLRKLSSKTVTQITKDGGPELFYGVPDWVYEEEVFAGNSVTWWSETGDYVAFLRTNDSTVPEYSIQYFVSRPSGKDPVPGEENYPEVRQLKYPKAGAPNPVVDLRFYDVAKDEVFAVTTDDDFPDNDRLITELVWVGKDGKAIVKNTNRESDILKVALIDVSQRVGRVVRTRDINKVDGGWLEVSETTLYVPSDPQNNRPHAGYIDTVIHDGYDHLGYFTPLDNPEPIMLTSGPWEVVDAPSAIDLVSNMVYFVATKESSLQRHVYSVNLDGTGLQHISNADKEGYYDVSFSTGGGFALLSYNGPDIPWQEIRSTPSYKGHLWRYEIETNENLAKMAAEHELPIKIYSTINMDGVELNVVERRPPHFDEKKQYPVLFQLYGGPGSQLVNKKFQVDFQTYAASNLGYIVVTLDGRGTGFIGRKARTIVRGHIGFYEGMDQIAAAKMWAAKPYVDAERIAIWGWSYGGFMALKTLELDGGETFKYGMAVAPVTDWRFYDSIYTERYMHTPQNNPEGYLNTSIDDTTALRNNVRFLIMHGAADDNVHMQNSLTLLDKLDLAGVENYDVHVFPDSNHGIYFHNANKIVYDKLNNWLINAFNGEWLRTENAVPVERIGSQSRMR